MKFTFSEEMIKTALVANGWGCAWNTNQWYHEDFGNPDYVSFETKAAFNHLLMKCNLIPRKVDECWSE